MQMDVQYNQQYKHRGCEKLFIVMPLLKAQVFHPEYQSADENVWKQVLSPDAEPQKLPVIPGFSFNFQVDG